MNAPKKVLTAKKPEEPKPVEAVAGKEGIKGTIHKPKGAPGATGAPAAGAGAKPGDKKSVKSEKLSSSWANDEKKRGGPTTSKGRSDAAAPGAGRSNSWKAPGGGEVVAVAIEATETANRTSWRRPSRKSSRSTSPKPSPWPIWLTRCR